jgi:hypothetical protein
VTLITHLLSFAKRLFPTTSIGKVNRDCVQPPIDQALIEEMSQDRYLAHQFRPLRPDTWKEKRTDAYIVKHDQPDRTCPQSDDCSFLDLETTTENENGRFSDQKENAWVYSSKGCPSSTYLPMRVQQNYCQNITMKLPSHHDPLLNAFINSRI